jgi:hypothetical protein
MKLVALTSVQPVVCALDVNKTKSKKNNTENIFIIGFIYRILKDLKYS